MQRNESPPIYTNSCRITNHKPAQKFLFPQNAQGRHNEHIHSSLVSFHSLGTSFSHSFILSHPLSPLLHCLFPTLHGGNPSSLAHALPLAPPISPRRETFHLNEHRTLLSDVSRSCLIAISHAERSKRSIKVSEETAKVASGK